MPQTSIAPMQAGFAGMNGDSTNSEADSYVSEEVSAEIPFGVMVAQGTSVSGAKLFASNADKMIGVNQHNHYYHNPSEIGLVGIKPKATMAIKKRGKVWVTVDEAVTPASPVRVRATGATAGTFRTSAVAGQTVNMSSFARFLTSTTGAGVVLLEFDITMRNITTND